MGDIVEQRVTPNTPRVIDNQEVKVYVPVASSSQKGVAKYNPTDFFIDSKGSVNLRHPISQQRAFANPLVDPEAMANIGQPGHENDNSVSLIKLLDIEFKHLQEGEYGYDPRSILGVLKLNREQLSQESLEKPSLVMLNSLDFLQIVTAEGYTKSNIRWPLYPIDDTTKDIVEDTTRSTLTLTYSPGSSAKSLSVSLGLPLVGSGQTLMEPMSMPSRFQLITVSLNGLVLEKLTYDPHTINIVIADDSESRVVQTYGYTIFVISKDDYKNPEFIKFLFYSVELLHIFIL